MILHTLCNSCLQPYEVTIAPVESRLVKELLDDDLSCVCPRLCGGRITLVEDSSIARLATSPQLREAMRISGQELYRAVNGAGLPDEIGLDMAVVSALLKAERPLEVVLQQDGKNVYLHEIRFKDATLHLTSGLRGAQVLKITKERAHAEQVP